MSGVGEDQPQECELLGQFGVLVQTLLGILCFLVLVFKRSLERPKRQWKIFLMDTTKQLASALVQHFLNVGLALILSKNDNGDECLWYFITYMLDCTLGVVLNCIFLTLFEKLFEKLGQRQFKSGNYYRIIYPNITTYSISSEDVGQTKKSKPKVEVDYGVYIFQLTLWTFIVVLSKVILYFFQLLLGQYLLDGATFLFQPVAGNPQVELLIIMVIIPLIFNAFSFWIQDSFLKKNKFQKKEKDVVLDALYEKSEEPVQVVLEETSTSSEASGIEMQNISDVNSNAGEEEEKQQDKTQIQSQQQQDQLDEKEQVNEQQSEIQDKEQQDL